MGSSSTRSVVRGLWSVLACAALVAGCGGSKQADSVQLPHDTFVVEQQTRTYEEAAGGIFVSLADFERQSDGRSGSQQVSLFSVEPPALSASTEFVVTVTRTGAGALSVSLPKGCKLVFSPGGGFDMSEYSILSVSIYVASVRDDLRILLDGPGGSWTSPRKLLRPGWNTVEVDVRRIRAGGWLGSPRVDSASLFFADAMGEVRFFLDDVLLIDNERSIYPAPAGMKLTRSGLDYSVSMPARGETIGLTQGVDGLWRLGRHQATIQLAGPDSSLPPGGEVLGVMGRRRIGQVELLEHNPVRLRFANTWYFPDRAGEWLSMSVRHIRWEYTLYADGRFVTHVVVNNAGGPMLDVLRMYLQHAAAWSAGVVAKDLVITDMTNPVGRWSYAIPPAGIRFDVLCSNYINPGRIEPSLASAVDVVDTDANGDGFDESQGCFRVRALGEHCRFWVHPPEEGILDPVVIVSGPWQAPVDVSCEGLAVRNVEVLGDGSAAFVIPGWLHEPAAVEVTGRARDSVSFVGESH